MGELQVQRRGRKLSQLYYRIGKTKLTVKTLIKVIINYTRKASFVGLSQVHLGSEVASAQGMETK